jgi:hypothetical protein
VGSISNDELILSDPTYTSEPPPSSRLIVNATIHFGHTSHTIPCLVDTGADDNSISQSTATELNLDLIELITPMAIGLASSIDSNDLTITHRTVPLQLHIGKHVETISFYVVPHLSLPIFLADSWLTKHNPTIDWKDKSMTFNSDFCLSECCVDTVVVYSNRTSGHVLPATNK